jgi:hypothetical protein
MIIESALVRPTRVDARPFDAPVTSTDVPRWIGFSLHANVGRSSVLPAVLSWPYVSASEARCLASVTELNPRVPTGCDLAGSGWATIGRNSSSDAFSGDDSGDVADLLVVKDDDVDVVFHAVVHRLCIHDLQVLGKDITE